MIDCLVELGLEPNFAAELVGRALKGPSLYGLTDEERIAIHVWSTALGLGVRLNEWIRRGGKPDDGAPGSRGFARMADQLDSGLMRLPEIHSESFRGYTAGEGLPALIASMQPGAVIDWPAFTSASARRDAAFRGDVLFIITGCGGRAIWPFSAEMFEFEILFPRGSRFRVVSLGMLSKPVVMTLEEICTP